MSSNKSDEIRVHERNEERTTKELRGPDEWWRIERHKVESGTGRIDWDVRKAEVSDDKERRKKEGGTSHSCIVRNSKILSIRKVVV